MRSTDYNIDNPMSVDMIGLDDKRYNANKERKVIHITQHAYDCLKSPDPHTIYIINDSNGKYFYYGEHLIEDKASNKLFLTPNVVNDKHWDLIIIFQNKPIKICTYSDLKSAARELWRISKTGMPYSLTTKMYLTIRNYTLGKINLENAILGLILDTGITSNDPEFQDLIRYINNMHDNKFPNGSERLRIELDHISHNNPSSLYDLYRRFYNIFIFNNFFKKFIGIPEDETIDIQDVISKLQEEYVTWNLL